MEQDAEIHRLIDQIIEMKGFTPLDRPIESAHVGYMDDARQLELEAEGIAPT